MSNIRAAAESQQRQQDKSQNRNNCDTWRDTIPNKIKKVMRIAFQNINGFGTSKKYCKAERIREFMEEKEIEVGKLAKVPYNSILQEYKIED